jgi:hypothetical protein
LLQLSVASTLHTCSLLHHLATTLLHARHGCCPPAPVPDTLKASHPRTPLPRSYPPSPSLFLLTPLAVLLLCLQSCLHWPCLTHSAAALCACWAAARRCTLGCCCHPSCHGCCCRRARAAIIIPPILVQDRAVPS